jgi:hypothetical protein
MDAVISMNLALWMQNVCARSQAESKSEIAVSVQSPLQFWRWPSNYLEHEVHLQ